MPLRIASRAFAPSWIATCLALAAIAAFVSLGRWQWGRGDARAVQWEEFQNGSGDALPLGSQGLGEVERFRRVTVTGEFDARHQFLLDNQVREGRAGYEVLTPFQLGDGPHGTGRSRLGGLERLIATDCPMSHCERPARGRSWPEWTSFPPPAWRRAGLHLPRMPRGRR